jgi:hypothetical protein
MPKTPSTRARVKALAVALTGLFVVSLGVFGAVKPAAAATSSNLNFQARLLSNTGAVVADGTYNIDFKLYTADSTTGSVGTCSGACVWEETRTGASKVQVINGYFSVNLGSVTPFGGSINWDQQLWLTMNIGGTGASPSWDGEMQNSGHSIALTALPYAFAANKLTTGTGSSRGTLSFASLGQATDITLPDPGGASATICYQGAAACNFIQNTTGGPQTANFNIQSGATGSVGGIISAASGQTADIFELKNSSIVFSVGNNGQTLIKPTAANDSATFFQVQNAGGNNVLAVDTASGQAVLGKASTLSGKLAFASAGGGTIILDAGSTANSYSLTLPGTGPALGQCLQNDATTIGHLTFGPCGANGTFLSKNATDTSSADAGSGYLYGFTNSGTAGSGGVLKLDNGNNTGSTLTATTAGNPASGKAVIYGENTNAAPSGSLLDLRSGSTPTSKFSVDASGNVVFGGTLNTNTFTSTSLVFTGASAASLQAASSQALNITGNASSLWQVGGTNQNLTIQTSGTGTLALDTTGAGTVSLGATNAATINIGSNNSTAISIGGTSLVGTVTNKVQGLTTTLTGAASNSSYVVKSTTNSNATFQVQNSGGNKVFSVDTSAGKTVLGQSNSVNGSLLFQNSTNTNGITLNTTSGSGAYTLTLPTAAPAGGLCIETSPGNASQLVFASCSNNNASIQEVAYWDANNVNTVSVSPTTAGDEMVLTTQIPTAGVTVTGVSGGGVPVGGWNKVIANSGNGTVNRVEMWVGTVATTGSSTITVTYSASPGSNEITTTEFTAAGVNASTSWGIESSGAQLNSTASTTVTYPNMTAVSGSELYVGYAQVQNPPANNGASCNTTNFSYQLTSTQHNMITYNTSLTANTAYQPIACQNTSGQSNTVAGVLTAFVTSSSINNTTSLQKANFYVQAATSGTVAGVLQAASSGTADIMDLRNSGGSNVLTVGSTGDVTVKGAASATAFQVQNGSGYGVMSVDTSGSQLVLGDATHLSGKITFKDSTDSNTISILAPASVAASYQLALPTNTPTAGLCLGTSPSNANQLIFASCATQVSAASITYINQWSNSGTNVTTVPVSPSSVGNLMVLFTHTANNVSIPGGGVSGGGVTNWTKVTSNVGATGIGNDEMWRGVVTTTGSSTITVSSFSGAGVDEITAQEYTMGGTGGGTWAIDTSGTLTGTSATINYPSLTPANSSELYAGYAWSANTPTPSGTAGYTYTATSSGKYTARNTSVTGGVATQPQSTQTSGNFNSIAAVIQAFAGTSVIVNSTATQQANFNVQAPLSGTVAGVLQGAASGTADILQVKDGSGNNVMTVNGTNGVTLGTAGTVGGRLVFGAGSNTNTVTILAPDTPGTTYQLKLPSAQAAPGQCLAASPSDNTQLVFSSCANQVTSVAINFVNSWNTNGNGVTTLAVSPANLNDLMTLFSSPRGAGSISNVTGGGVSVWSKVTSTTAGSGADTSSIDMWKGVVTTTGASTITVTFSGSSGNPNELAAMEFSTGSTTGSWVVDASNTQYNSVSSTTITFPSLTPQSSRDLYVGYAASGSAYTSGSTTGFTYLSGSLTNRVGIYNTSVSSATQPTATTTGSSTSLAVGALVAAYSSSSVISNSTVTQQANFNIQAATSTSVAGVLQAFPGSSADILQIMDGAGAVVDKFGSYGNLLIKPSTASAAAFQVQNTSSVNVLSVDTSLKQVVVGAGSTGETSPSLLVLDNQTGSSADPATAVNGAMYYNATTHTFRCGVAGAWQNCSGMLYANTSKSSASSNCSNNCAAFSTAANIPANYCQAGRVIKLLANGYFSSQATASQLQFGVYYGTDSSVAANDTLIGTLSPAASVTSASNNYFELNFNAICFSTSSMMAQGVLNLQTGTAAAGMTALPLNSTSPTTVVTTSAKNLYIFPIWDTATASNTATITQFSVSAP